MPFSVGPFAPRPTAGDDGPMVGGSRASRHIQDAPHILQPRASWLRVSGNGNAVSARVARMNPGYPFQPTKRPSSAIETRSADIRVEEFKPDRPQARQPGWRLSSLPGLGPAPRVCAQFAILREINNRTGQFAAAEIGWPIQRRPPGLSAGY